MDMIHKKFDIYNGTESKWQNHICNQKPYLFTRQIPRGVQDEAVIFKLTDDGKYIRQHNLVVVFSSL